MRQLIKAGAAVLLLALVLSGPGAAQGFLATAESGAASGPQFVTAFGDWQVFDNEDPEQCFAIALATTETGWPEAQAGGQSRLLVTFRPGRADLPGEISLSTDGRRMAAGTLLSVTAGGGDFPMFSDGAWAWTPDSGTDSRAAELFATGGSASILLRTPEMEPVTLEIPLDGFAEAAGLAHGRCTMLGM